MKLNSIIDRIGQEVAALKLVGGAVEFEKASQGLTALPAAFVLPANERASDNDFMAQVVQQQVTLQFVVMIAVRNLSDREGVGAVEALQPVRHATRQALLNWVPEGADEGIEFQSGSMLQFSNSDLWWQDFYTTAYLIRSEQ